MRFFDNKNIQRAARKGLHRLIELFGEIDLKEANIDPLLSLPLDELIERMRYLHLDNS